MTSVSTRLRAAREEAGLTIADISASTKLTRAALLALERGEFTKLPGDFYTRAFLRTYARELHLSPDAVVAEYDADRQPAQPLPLEPAPSPQVPALQASMSPLWASVIAIGGNGAVVVALVIVLLGLTVTRNRPNATRLPESGAVGTSGAAAAVPAAAVTPRQVPAEKLAIEIQAVAPIWVTGAADGRRVLYRLLAPGERVTVEARNELAFRVGNAAAFTYSINGVAGKPVGGPGEVRDLRITRDNYRAFGR